MQLDIPLTNLGLSDLNVIIAGSQDCEPGHAYGPAVRQYYLIHYITSGEGIFRRGGSQYRLGGMQGFLICPGEVTYYEASKDNPWHYIWIGFSGARAFELLRQAGLDAGDPVFSSRECFEIFKDITRAINMDSGRELYLMSQLYAFFAVMSKNTLSAPKSYASKAAGYIAANMGMDLKIGAIADMLGLDRRYFCQVFKREYGISPQQYLIKTRMESAKSLLEGTQLSIGDIARSVGYADQLAFSRMFKLHCGMSPTEFRISKKRAVPAPDAHAGR